MSMKRNRHRLSPPGRTWCVLAGACSAVASMLAHTSHAAAPPTVTPPVRELEITDHEGGTHHRLLLHEGTWYQTFSNTLQVLDPASGHLVQSIELQPFGQSGQATDMAIHGDRLWVVLDRSGIVEISIAKARQPEIVARRSALELGLRPRRVSVTDGAVFVSGIGGVMRLDNGQRFLQNTSCGAVVSSGAGLVTTVGRDITRLEDGSFAGIAMELVEVPADAGIGAALFFALQAESGVRIGTLDRDLNEIDSTAVAGIGRSLRCAQGRLWIVTDTEISSFPVTEGRLGAASSFRVRGARDVGPAAPNTLAVSGSFGRSLYRIDAEGDLPGDTFYRAHREPSRLSRAVTDRRRVLAGGAEGNWLYLFGAAAERSDRELDATLLPVRQTALPWGSARIGDDGRTVHIDQGGAAHIYEPEAQPVLGCVAAIGTDLWIGHELGIDVVAPDEDGKPHRVDQIRMEGMVHWIFPKWDGGGVFVSEFGGFGTAIVRERPMTEEEAAAWTMRQEARAERLRVEADAARRQEKP